MTADSDKADLIQRYKSVLALHERTLKYLESLHIDPNILRTYKAVLHHLRTRTEDQIVSLLGEQPKSRTLSEPATQPEISDSAIEKLTLDEVRRFTIEKATSRQLLERIARIRFAVTKGAISGLRSRNALVEKLNTLIDHEKTHDSIARAAATDQTKS